jgi:hypothetical protein
MHTAQCVCRPALHIIHSGTPETELQIDDKVAVPADTITQVFNLAGSGSPIGHLEKIEFFGFVLPNCGFVLGIIVLELMGCW